MQQDLLADTTGDFNSASPAPQSRKRKVPSTTGVGGRGVASLTPDQLAKKRANDREAQRAIRERTKTTIETLERRIQELTSQQPYQELQAIIRQKDAIQAENDEIRRRLASILSIIQPVVGAQGLTDLATAAQHNVQVGLGQQTDVFQQSDQYLNGQQSRSYANASPGLEPVQQDPNNYPSPYSTVEQAQNVENRIWTNSRDALHHQRDNLQKGLELSENGERLSFNFLLDSLAQRHPNMQPVPSGRTSPGPHSSYPTIAQAFSDPNNSQPTWMMLPKNSAPTCPLDNILLNFLKARQREHAEVNGSSSYISPAYPSVSSLLNPTSTTTIDPLSHLMTEIISKFQNIRALPEQAAVLFFMFLYMRWQIYPTQENYERLPEWLTPRPSQLFTSHPAWIDHLPWPRMRDKIIHHQENYLFENWFLPFTVGLSVNWPYEEIDCLLCTSENEDPIINPVFERHIRRLENWSLGPQFAKAYPQLADTTSIKEILEHTGPQQDVPTGGEGMINLQHPRGNRGPDM